MSVQYIDGAVLGRGAFAEVREVQDPFSGEKYAKKTLVNQDIEDVRRFEREVRLLQGFDHPNVVKVLETQLLQPPFWFIMPLYPKNLKEQLATSRGDIQWIHQAFTQILNGVEHIHQRGSVHRDLKPANVLVSGSSLVVADFGLGRRIDSDSMGLTRSNDMLGTYDYVAPEQIDNPRGNLSPAADVFSLGRILYECFLPRLTFGAFNADYLQAPIRRLFYRATAHEPDARYQTVTDFRLAFEETMTLLQGGNLLLNTDSLISQFRALGAFDGEAKQQVAKAMIYTLDATSEPSAVYEVLLKLPPDFFAELALVDVAATRKFTRQFFEYATIPSDRWEDRWNYIDVIANAAKRLFTLVRDEEIRATLAETVLTVGHKYNRYDAMKVLGEMLTRVREPSEVAYMCLQLGEYSQGGREFARRYFAENVDLALQLSMVFPR